MAEFRPKRIKQDKLDDMILDCIECPISADADVTEMYWWLSVIPEALRYLYRKRKKICRAIDDVSDRLDEISAKFRLVYIHSSKANGNITERKDFADSMKLAKSPEYKQLKNQLNAYTELLNACDADITNVEQKSVMVRKMTNIESSRVIYDED